MRTVALLLVLLPSIAAAETLGGTQLTVAPVVETGSLGGWLAGSAGPAYVGGEIAVETMDLTEGDFGISYHVLVGHRHALTQRVHVLVDAGAGITQEERFRLGLFGGESEGDTVALVPSGALRAQLAVELGHISDIAVAIGVGSEARGAFSSDEASGGLAVGFAMVLSGGSAAR